MDDGSVRTRQVRRNNGWYVRACVSLSDNIMTGDFGAADLVGETAGGGGGVREVMFIGYTPGPKKFLPGQVGGGDAFGGVRVAKFKT